MPMMVLCTAGVRSKPEPSRQSFSLGRRTCQVEVEPTSYSRQTGAIERKPPGSFRFGEEDGRTAGKYGYLYDMHIVRLHKEFKRRIKIQTVLPSAETAAMLFRGVDGVRPNLNATVGKRFPPSRSISRLTSPHEPISSTYRRLLRQILTPSAAAAPDGTRSIVRVELDRERPWAVLHDPDGHNNVLMHKQPNSLGTRPVTLPETR